VLESGIYSTAAFPSHLIGSEIKLTGHLQPVQPPNNQVRRMADSPEKKKRKRDVKEGNLVETEARITYHAPFKTFERLFNGRSSMLIAYFTCCCLFIPTHCVCNCPPVLSTEQRHPWTTQNVSYAINLGWNRVSMWSWRSYEGEAGSYSKMVSLVPSISVAMG
jgi:hypothetical protein